MGNENGEWIMRGLDWDDPKRIKTPSQLIKYIDEVGFLPLFANTVPGFSVEDHVSPLFWWTGDPMEDPWEWRAILARSGKVAYGKFFDKKAGFISLKWLPDFVNYRRDGYDFDARWDDELASIRSKKIVDLFEKEDELYSFEIKKKAGFGKEGEKNFDGTLTDLQMQTYLVTKDFRRRKRKTDGKPYGWAISVLSTPEKMWGYDLVSASYKDEPETSKQRILDHMKKLYPDAKEENMMKMIRIN